MASDGNIAFYTPFGVRCFGTAHKRMEAESRNGFYTPFGVRCFGTAIPMAAWIS